MSKNKVLKDINGDISVQVLDFIKRAENFRLKRSKLRRERVKRERARK